MLVKTINVSLLIILYYMTVASQLSVFIELTLRAWSWPRESMAHSFLPYGCQDYADDDACNRSGDKLMVNRRFGEIKKSNGL